MIKTLILQLELVTSGNRHNYYITYYCNFYIAQTPTVRPRAHYIFIHYIVCYSEQYVRLKRNVFRPHLLLFLAAFSIDQQCCVAFDQYNQDVHHVQLTCAVTACAAYIEDSAVIINVTMYRQLLQVSSLQ